MKYGVGMFTTDYSMTPPELAMAAETRGFESLWFPEHSHIPADRRSPWPGGGDLPKQYYDVLDPLVALGACAAVTKSIRLCTGICLVIQRDPIQLAKEVATLDHISQGRVTLGVGGGWNAEEMANHGTAFKTRFALMRERIAAMKTIWTEDKPEYHGEFVDFDPIMTWPKPVQKPYPPIVVGGGFPHGAKRAIEYGDAWMPLGGRGSDILALLPRVRQMAAEAGREPDALPVQVFGAEHDASRLAQYRDGGIDRAVFMLPSAGSETVLPLLDKLAGLADT